MALIFGDCFSMSSIISIALSAICIGVTVRDLQQIKKFQIFPIMLSALQLKVSTKLYECMQLPVLLQKVWNGNKGKGIFTQATTTK